MSIDIAGFLILILTRIPERFIYCNEAMSITKRYLTSLFNILS